MSETADRTTAIVLAAGQGTRMKSDRAKVMHELCGRPMVDYVLEAALAAGAAVAVVVVGRGREPVTEHLRETFGERVKAAVQAEQRGTGHAVACALQALPAPAEIAFVLYGDTPLLHPADLARLRDVVERRRTPLGLVTCRLPDPTGYGRIIRDGSGAVVAVREHRDASDEERAIDEVNAGVYAARVPFLRQALGDLQPDNDQGEIYLTDVVALGAARGGVADIAAPAASLAGINDRAQLARAEEAMYERIADLWRRRGTTVRAGARVDALVELGPDAVIEPGAALRGRTRIGARARVDTGAVLTDVAVANEAHVKPYVVAQDAAIGARAEVGPFAQLRAGTVIEEDARVGNFVETKKTRLRRGAKANHLAYLGDGDIGEGANVGAGTIFCNYDGVLKHRTVIGARAFIGSDSQLVAPVTVGEDAYVGTGTTVTLDVPADALAIGRAKQVNKEGYATRLRAKLEARSRKSR